MTKALSVNTDTGNPKQIDVVAVADTSITAAAGKVPVAGISGYLDASWGVTSGTPSSAVDDQIRNTLALNNSNPLDTKIVAGDYTVFIYLASHNVNSWKTATYATHTVSIGKKLVLIETRLPGAMQADYAYRRWRLYNTTDAVEVYGPTIVGSSSNYPGYPWFGDISIVTCLPEVAAGKTVRLDLWNGDTTRRAIGVVLICREVPA